jgi:hypothetical protein
LTSGSTSRTASRRPTGVRLRPRRCGTRPTARGSPTSTSSEELLLDPQTFEYIGERSTVTKDTIVNKEKVGNSTGQVRKGQQVAALQLAIGIVDQPGERP